MAAGTNDGDDDGFVSEDSDVSDGSAGADLSDDEPTRVHLNLDDLDDGQPNTVLDWGHLPDRLTENWLDHLTLGDYRRLLADREKLTEAQAGDLEEYELDRKERLRIIGGPLFQHWSNVLPDLGLRGAMKARVQLPRVDTQLPGA